MSFRIIDLDLYDFLGAFVVLSVIVYIIKYMILEKKTERRYWIYPISILYVLFLIEITILPIEILGDDMLIEIFGTDKGMNWKSYIQVIPFATILQYYSEGNMYQLIGNILLLMPLPFLIMLFDGNITFTRLSAISFITSVTIEIAQLIVDIATKHLNRVCDIDDIILNTVGAICTSVFVILLRKFKFFSSLYHLCIYRK